MRDIVFGHGITATALLKCQILYWLVAVAVERSGLLIRRRNPTAGSNPAYPANRLSMQDKILLVHVY